MNTSLTLSIPRGTSIVIGYMSQSADDPLHIHPPLTTSCREVVCLQMVTGVLALGRIRFDVNQAGFENSSSRMSE